MLYQQSKCGTNRKIRRMRIVLKYTNIIITVCVLVKYLMRQVVYAIFKLEKMNQKYLFNLLRPTGHQQNETQGIITEEAL